MTLPAPIVRSDPEAEVRALAARWRRANGPVISLVNRFGGRLEDRLSALPEPVRDRIGSVTERALVAAHGLAATGNRAPDLGPRGPVAAAMLTGAAGGAGGLVTALAELPLTVTLILHAIRQAAREAGFDPDDPAVRAECLAVFGSGSPLAQDDGVNTAFLSARLALTGPGVQRVITMVAPRLAAALGQKLAAQAVPILGAAMGAALNAAFLGYYRELARIRFALLRLAAIHGPDRVLTAFRAAAGADSVARG